MAVYQGTYYTKGLNFTVASTGAVINITGQTFSMEVRNQVDDTDALLTLTTAGGGLVVTDGPNGRLELRMTAVQTALLPLGKLVFDILRTDASPGPVWTVGGSFKVKQPVTR